MVPGGNGIFDVIVDGDTVFSKYDAGGFPEDGEVVEKMKKAD